MNTIFISHSRKDAGFAEKLAGDLRRKGHPAVSFKDWERDNKKEGSEADLSNAISSFGYFVPVITPEVQERPWLRKDLENALAAEAPHGRVTILPVLKEPCVLPEPLGLRTPVDFSKSYTDGLHNLVDRLAAPPPGAQWRAGLDFVEKRVMTAFGERREDLHELSPEAFERAVVEIFSELGSEVRLSQFVRDGDVDLVAVGGSDASKRNFLIQCKRYVPGKHVAVELVKAVRPLDITRDGRTHVVTTCLFIDRAKWQSGRTPECLTHSRWELPLVEWISMKPHLESLTAVSEPLGDLDRARDRYAELVDKKFESSLSEVEQAELLRLQERLNNAEAEFYEPIKKRLEMALADSSSPTER